MITLLTLMLLCVSELSRGEEDVCSLPLRTGPCRARFWVWGFNSASGQCETFVYGGCGGNANRFDEKMDCERACVMSPHLKNHKSSLDQGITGKYTPLPANDK